GCGAIASSRHWRGRSRRGREHCAYREGPSGARPPGTWSSPIWWGKKEGRGGSSPASGCPSGHQGLCDSLGGGQHFGDIAIAEHGFGHGVLHHRLGLTVVLAGEGDIGSKAFKLFEIGADQRIFGSPGTEE